MLSSSLLRRQGIKTGSTLSSNIGSSSLDTILSMNLPPLISRCDSFLSRKFHSSPTLHKFMRIIDPELSNLNKGKRNKRDLLQEIEDADIGFNVDELMSQAEYEASKKKARLERKNRSKDSEHPYSAYNFTVTIIGRPNVGKSSLFNRLIGRQSAIVDGSSGVTRDWHDDRASLGGLDFRVIDTAGLEQIDWSVMGGNRDKNDQYLDPQFRNNGQNLHNPFGQALKPEKRSGKGIQPTNRKQTHALSNRDAKNMSSNYVLGRPLAPDLQQDILNLTKTAVENSDIVIFMFDTKVGVTPLDQHFAQWLRKLLTPKGPTPEEERNLKFNYSSRSVLRSIHSKPVILLGNKYDFGSAGDDSEENLIDSYKLGFGAPIPFSAAHGSGVGELQAGLTSAMTQVLKTWDEYQTRIKDLHKQVLYEEKNDIVQLKKHLTASEDDLVRDPLLEGEVVAVKTSSGLRRPTRTSLLKKSSKLVPTKPPVTQSGLPRVVDEDAGKEVIKVVIAGKPNVGKSTLINALLGETRMLTGPQPGVTRDSIAVRWRLKQHPDHVFELVDTAGVKGVSAYAHSKFDRVDSMAMHNTVRSVGKSNVVVLVIDVVDGLYGQGIDPLFAGQIHKNFVANMTRGPSTQRERMMAGKDHKSKRARSFEANQQLMVKRNPDKQAYQDKLSMLVSRVAGCVSKHDMDVAKLASEHGKALVILANKIDLLEGGEEEVKSVLKGLQTLFSFNLAQNKGVTIIPISAKENQNLTSLPERLIKVHKKWSMRVNTGLLNRWLRALLVLRPPPSVDGHRFNIKYVTQTNIRPPTFSFFSSRKTDFPEDYINFLTNSLRDEFNLHGCPIRVHIRTGENPYVENRVLSRSEKRKISRRNLRDRIDKKKSIRNKNRLPSNRLR